ncbi:hypothetical protein EYF80_030797 [Liparis tanakae]|uniref:Uncharacterized protein n=1 Tax=Liparis tanakae TaxID=230148 RepID=A0A4Z2H1L6_9TELE|nr:hypothetical protein EYF80_030797 [Liparis tanakae]
MWYATSLELINSKLANSPVEEPSCSVSPLSHDENVLCNERLTHQRIQLIPPAGKQTSINAESGEH